MPFEGTGGSGGEAPNELPPPPTPPALPDFSLFGRTTIEIALSFPDAPPQTLPGPLNN